ncbi:MAG: hypothetical protein Q7V57_08320 [Actinomycetota bacterium]|nr:hypothetical protein [Actinomycetota bacterium]
MNLRGLGLVALAALTVGCTSASSAAPDSTSTTLALSGLPTSASTVPPVTAAPTTTTTVFDLQAIPGRHIGAIPEDETVLCPQAADVPIAGELLAMPDYPNRPTSLQRAADPAAPLLVVFHGQHGCIQNVQSRSDLDVMYAAAGVHVLWLSGEPVPTRSWRVNNGCCEPADTKGINDKPYIEAAMAAARAAGLTSTTVLAIGVSNGGGMAITAGCAYPELFTGVVVVAGWISSSCGRASQSMLAFGGSLDQSLGSRTAAGITDMWRSSVVDCPAEPMIETYEARTTTTWWGCTDNTVVRLVQLEGVPHVWPKFTFYDMDDDIILFALGKYATGDWIGDSGVPLGGTPLLP